MRGRAAGLVAIACLGFGSPALAGRLPVAGCTVFPPDNIWNVPVDNLPVHPMSDAYVASIGADEPLKGDFGAGLWEGSPMGIPFTTAPFDVHRKELRFRDFGDEPAVPDESDVGTYAIPPDAPVEGGDESEADRHVLVIEEVSCTLYELYKAVPLSDGSWGAVSGVRFDLEGNELRLEGMTSADAAGLPVFPGLVRWEEVEAGVIDHALRFTAPVTQRAYVWPARHFASDDDSPELPPMGMRFRLRADFDISGFSPANQVILRALKTYGMMLADNGSPWFVSGAPNDNWDNDDLFELSAVKGSDFEAVDTSSLMISPDSAQANIDGAAPLLVEEQPPAVVPAVPGEAAPPPAGAGRAPH